MDVSALGFRINANNKEGTDQEVMIPVELSQANAYAAHAVQIGAPSNSVNVSD